MSTGESGAETYEAFIAAELTELRAVKTSLEQRGAAVITSAGALVTLLFALVGLITSRDKYNLPDAAHDWLYAALALFFAAAMLALFVALPLLYRAPTPRGLAQVVRNRWSDDKASALRRVAITNIDVIASYKRMNAYKAYALITAIALEALAVGAIAVVAKIVIDNA